jgi:hypothetical protein
MQQEMHLRPEELAQMAQVVQVVEPPPEVLLVVPV